MIIDGCQFMVDGVTKFFNSLRVSGWFHHPDERLAKAEIVGDQALAAVSEIDLPHGGVEAVFGPGRGFAVQILRPYDGFEAASEVAFTTDTGRVVRANLADLARERMSLYPTPQIALRFMEAVNAKPGARVLDIGGRARSRIDRSAAFTSSECVVLDILAGDNVDVVGDAHALDRHFPADSFDAVQSVSVFEHLMMPWAVIPQINHVLRPGGIALIATHQTLGMHDMPWDFWRFSDTAWDALFNHHTGFEIIERALDGEQFIVPFLLRPAMMDAEKAAGYESSVVLVRKIGPCAMQWKLTPGDINATMYPQGQERAPAETFNTRTA